MTRTRGSTQSTQSARLQLLWLLVALAFIALPSAQAQLFGILGNGVSCGSGANTISYLADDISLSFISSAAGTVTLASVLSAPASLPSGCQQLRFGTLGLNAGYLLSASSGVQLSSVTIVTGAVSGSTAGLISASSPAGCLQYDSALGAYARVAVSAYDSATHKISVALPQAGSYVFAAIADSVSLAAGAQANLAAQSGQVVHWANGVALQYGSSAANQISCTVSSAPSAGANALLGVGTSLGAYINFVSAAAAAHTSTISYTYTAAQLAAAGIVDEARLRIAFYDSGCGCWQFPAAGASVDVAARVVTQVGVAANELQPCGVFELPYQLGAQVALAAGQAACLTYSTGAQLRATASAATNVALDVVGSAQASLPSGCAVINFAGAAGAHVGYAISSANAAALGAVQLSTAAVTSASASVIAQAGNTAGCLQATASGYVRVAIQSYNTANGVIALQIANAVSGAQYVFAAIQSNIQAQVGAAVSVAGNAQQQISWGAQVGLSFASATANQITCAVSSAPSVGAAAAAQAGVALGAFLDFSLATAAAHTSTIRYTFTAAELAAANIVDATLLRIAFYDSGCGCWQFPASGLVVNVATNTITQVVTGTNIGLCGVFGQFLQLGQNVNIPSGSATLNFVGGVALSFASSAAATVSVNAITSAATSLPAGCAAIAVGEASHIGYYVQASAAVLSNVVLSTPQVTAAGAAAIAAAGGASAAAALQLAGSAYTRLNIQSYANGIIQFAIPSGGCSGQNYIFAAIASSVQANLGEAISVAGNANQQLRWGAQVALQFGAAAANSITCTHSTVPTVGGSLIGAGASLGAYVNFAFGVAGSAGAHSSVISYTYTAAQLAAAGIVDETRLRLAFWDSVAGCWTFPSTGAAINVGARVVSQTVASATGAIAPCGVFELPYAAGATVAVTGAQLVNAVYASGARISLTTSAATNLALSAVASAPSQLPSGCTAVSFPSAAGAVGFALSSSNSAAVIANAVISTPAVSAAAAAAIAAAGNSAGCLRSTASGYVRVAIQSYTAASGVIALQVANEACDGSAFVFAAIQSQISAGLGQAVALAGNAQQTIQVGSQLAVQYVSSAANSLTCTISALPSQGASTVGQAGVSLGVFLNIASSASAQGAVTTVTYTYTQLQLTLAGIINAAGLRIGFYNPSCNCWQIMSGASVNVQARTITQVFAGTSSAPAPYCGIFLPSLFKQGENNGAASTVPQLASASPASAVAPAPVLMALALVPLMAYALFKQH